LDSQDLEIQLCEYGFLKPYCQRVKESISQKRFFHVLRVTKLAAEIAKANNFEQESFEAAVLAAFLHDIAKELPDKEMFELAPAILEMEKVDSKVVHGRAGRELAKNWGVKSEAVLEAIAGHVTGVEPDKRIGMVVYIADVAEPGRGVNAEIGEMAKTDLSKAYKAALNTKVNYLKLKGKVVHPSTISILEEM